MSILPKGLVPVVQTPFDASGDVDDRSLRRLVEDAIAAGANGLLCTAVASEVTALTALERERIVRTIADASGGRVPLVVGASADRVAACRGGARLAEAVGACAYLVACPGGQSDDPAEAVAFLAAVAAGSGLPLVVQDLDWSGPGLPLDAYQTLLDAAPTVAGVKIETAPAGPKFTAVRDRFGSRLDIWGGWAVPQLIEALDRDIDAVVPESSMLRVYRVVLDLHAAGDRDRAVEVFRDLLPVLAFTNQELQCSIAFFKRLLQRKGIFSTDRLRPPGFAWDRYNSAIAEELIAHYLDLERAHS